MPSFALQNAGAPPLSIGFDWNLSFSSSKARWASVSVAANLKVAEKYVEAFAGLAKTGNTLIVPANLTDVSTFVSTAMTVLDRTRATSDAPK